MVNGMLRAVFFDLDHTLYDRDATLTRMAPMFAASFNDCFGESPYCNEMLAERLIAADRMNYLGWPATYGELERSLPWNPPGYARFKEFLSCNLGKCATPYPETASVLNRCRNMGFTIGMITNGTVRLQNEKIDSLGFRASFGHIIISEEFGMAKPDPSIFLHAARLAGLEPNEIVFVGDNPINDILASAAVGMVPIWLDHFLCWPENIERPINIAHKLAEVPEIIEGMIR